MATVALLSNSTYNELIDLPIIKEIVLDPKNNTILENSFTRENISFFEPKISGVYTLVMTNTGKAPTIINGLFGYFPYSNSAEQINDQMFLQFIVGLFVLITGLLCISAGYIIRMYGIYIMDIKFNQ